MNLRSLESELNKFDGDGLNFLIDKLNLGVNVRQTVASNKAGGGKPEVKFVEYLTDPNGDIR